MPQPVSYNTGVPVSGSIQENNISYVVDGQNRDYRGGFGGLSWMSELPAENNVVFIGNSTTIGRGPAGKPLFYPAFNNSDANVIYAANTLPGSPRNFTTTAGAYNWATTNNFLINNSNNPIPRPNADNLVVYVDASQASSYPQTGTTWHNLIAGFVPNGTLGSGVIWDSDGWMYFNGTQNTDFQVAIPVTRGTLGNNMSIEATFKYDGSSGAGYRPIIGGNDPGSGTEFFLGKNSGNNYFGVQDGNYDGAFVTGYDAFDGRWHHMVYTYNNNTGELYLDGVLRNTGAFTKCNDGEQIYIGAEVQEGYWWEGNISQVKYYTQTLSTSEVKQNYFQSNIVTDGLIFMVDANNLVSYPKSGTTAYALTGSNNGTLVNGVAYGYPNGGYWNFDGTDDSINIGTLSYSNNITLEAWVNTTNPTGWDDIIAGGCGDLLFGINSSGNGTLSWGGQCNVPFSPVTSTISITDGNWHHVIGTYNGSVAALYIDGNLEVSSARSGNFTPGNIAIGSAGGGSEYFNGKIASVRIYSKALTATEVQQNYQSTKYKFQGQQIVTSGLVLNLDAANKDSYPGTGTTWYDLSGNGNNGTLLNGVGFNPYQNGGTLTFDGVDDYVSIPDINFTTATIDIWVYINAYSAGGAVFVYQSSNGFEVWAGTDNIIRYNKNPSTGLTSGPGFTVNSWNNIVATSDGTTNRLYLNNVNIGSTNGGIFDNTSGDIRISGYGGYMVNGRCSILKMYNRALSATEISQNFNASKGRFGL